MRGNATGRRGKGKKKKTYTLCASAVHLFRGLLPILTFLKFFLINIDRSIEREGKNL